MTRRPPRSTLFPTRRSSDLIVAVLEQDAERRVREHLLDRAIDLDRAGRSEEHTSELQSRGHLVCRLLLEKKTRRLPGGRTAASPSSRCPASTLLSSAPRSCS